ncbi:unnamed protein product, partial [Closterium sp. NIES-65]
LLLHWNKTRANGAVTMAIEAKSGAASSGWLTLNTLSPCPLSPTYASLLLHWSKARANGALTMAVEAKSGAARSGWARANGALTMVVEAKSGAARSGWVSLNLSFPCPHFPPTPICSCHWNKARANGALTMVVEAKSGAASLLLHWNKARANGALTMAVEAKSGAAKSGWISLAWTANNKMAPADAVFGNLAGGKVARTTSTGTLTLMWAYSPLPTAPTTPHHSPHFIPLCPHPLSHSPPLSTTHLLRPHSLEFARKHSTGSVSRFLAFNTIRLLWAYSTLPFTGPNRSPPLSTSLHLLRFSLKHSTGSVSRFLTYNRNRLLWCGHTPLPPHSTNPHLSLPPVISVYSHSSLRFSRKHSTGFVSRFLAYNKNRLLGRITVDFSCKTAATGGGKGGGEGDAEDNDDRD